MNSLHAAGAARNQRAAMLTGRMALTPEELEAALRSAAERADQRACLRFVAILLQPFEPAEHLSFWLRPRDSLHGHTPLQALNDCDLHRLREAAEAFADA